MANWCDGTARRGSTWAGFTQFSVGLPAAGATPTGQKTEEDNRAFTFNGAWTPARDANASGGAYTASNTVGASVTFSITGNKFVLYRRVDPTGGYADVTVDGKNIGTLTFYFPETRWQVPAAIDQLGDGGHTIVLTVARNQPRGSTGTNVYFDAVENPAPASLGPTEAQLTAVARTNFYRSMAGLPPRTPPSGPGSGCDRSRKVSDGCGFHRQGQQPARRDIWRESQFFRS